MLTVFSPEFGKLSVLAKGCRKPKSRFLHVAQLFSHCGFELIRYKEIYIIKQADIYNAFYSISNDMIRLAHATYILNLTEEVVTEGEENHRIFNLLTGVLDFLSRSDIKPEEVTPVYELKLISLVGYQPELDGCTECGADISKEMKFGLDEGGLLCSNCETPDSLPINIGTILTMRHILEMDLNGLKVLKFHPEIQKQLNKILSEYIFYKLDKRIKSRDFLNPNFYRMT